MYTLMQLVRWHGEVTVLGRNQAMKMLLEKSGFVPTLLAGEAVIR
jgi:hypothetical protein